MPIHRSLSLQANQTLVHIESRHDQGGSPQASRLFGPLLLLAHFRQPFLIFEIVAQVPLIRHSLSALRKTSVEFPMGVQGRNHRSLSIMSELDKFAFGSHGRLRTA